MLAQNVIRAMHLQLGLYWTPENYKAQVAAKMSKLKAESDGTMRDFLSKSGSIGVDPAVQASLLKALDGVETKLGRAMLANGDKEGKPLFDAAVAEIKKEHGFDKMTAKEQLAKGDYDTVCTPPWSAFLRAPRCPMHLPGSLTEVN